MSQKYKDLASIAILIGSGVWIKRLRNKRSENEAAVGAIPPAPSFHLRDSCFITVAPVLGYIQSKLTDKDLYIASIEGMRIRLLELQDDDKEAKKLRSKQMLPEG